MDREKSIKIFMSIFVLPWVFIGAILCAIVCAIIFRTMEDIAWGWSIFPEAVHEIWKQNIKR